ncbi:hypothetical protein I0K15_02590 [Pontivivens ytuae]|uniref:YhhN-like protein n=2 Tax=Pontivivens ytuae TaxID=2789856 RepID=A0A7S9LT29_9RHOB|nr:hypothetical protein I0K15_02590 [Pontivivens ytuae]
MVWMIAYLAWITAALSCAGSLAYVGYYQLRSVSVPRMLAKVTATGGLALTALLLERGWLLVAALGVAALADYVKTFRTEATLMTAISLSSIFNVLLSMWFLTEHWSGLGAPFVAAGALAGIAGGYAILVWPHMGRLRGIVLPYMVTVLVAVLTGLGAGESDPLLTIGVLLYMLSVILLGFELMLFHNEYRFLRVVGPMIWLLYYSGLAFFVLGGGR